MITVKVLKATAFTAKGEQHTHYSVAFKGRGFGVSTLAFAKEDLELVGDTLNIKPKCEVSIRKETDTLTGITTQYNALVPELGLSVGV